MPLKHDPFPSASLKTDTCINKSDYVVCVCVKICGSLMVNHHKTLSTCMWVLFDYQTFVIKLCVQPEKV